MTINLLSFHLKALLMAGIGSSSCLAESSPTLAEPKCVTSLTVSSSITGTPPSIAVTVTDSNGKECSSFPCSFYAASGVTSVGITYKTASDKYIYLDASGSTVTNSPTRHIDPTCTPAGCNTVDFAVVGDDDGTLLWLPDPRITVTSGGCT